MTTVYFAGTEDVSFVSHNGAGITTNTNFFRTAFSRSGLQHAVNNTAFPPTVAYWSSPTITPVSAFWFHARVSPNTINTTVANNPALCFSDGSGVWRLGVMGTGTAGQLAIFKRSAAGTITTLATSAAQAFPASTAIIAIDLNVNYSTTGRAQLYVDGQLVADTGASVDVTTDSATSIGTFFMNTPGNSPGNFIWSEIILQDTDTRGCALQTLPPVAAGNTQSWTPNTVGNVNPTTINDTNFVSTTSANALSEWTLSTTLPAGSWAIEAIVQAARVSAGATGPQNYEFLTRTVDGTDHVQGTTTPPIGSFGNAFSVWNTNPFTGTAWTTGQLINSGIESLT
jgi:hypothetical protein